MTNYTKGIRASSQGFWNDQNRQAHSERMRKAFADRSKPRKSWSYYARKRQSLRIKQIWKAKKGTYSQNRKSTDFALKENIAERVAQKIYNKIMEV